MKRYLIFYALLVLFVLGCSQREVVRENQIPDFILEDDYYIGRLPEHPDVRRKHLYYYNTEKLCFYYCNFTYVHLSGAILWWRYISLEKLKSVVIKRQGK